MILDAVERISVYRSLSPHFATAIDYLVRTDPSTVSDGQVSVAGDDVVAIFQSYLSKPPAKGKWETHRKYADIQLMLEGEECMGVRDVRGMEELEPFNSEKDYAFWKGSVKIGQSVIVRAGQFAIFFPHDAHMPSLAIHQQLPVRKVVMKVAV